MKSFEIQKRLVYEAWMKVQANNGAPGVDAVSIERFADNERDNLYKLWNRMSSGSYFPGPVRAVEIPKDHGTGVRVLEAVAHVSPARSRYGRIGQSA
jgi:retron-type reverse transcriptase